MLQQNLKIWKFASETMAGVLSRFSFATAAEKQLKQWKHWKSTAFWLLIWKNWCFEQGIAKEIKITSQPSLTLCSSDPTPKLETNKVNPQKQWFHFIESDSDRLNNSLNCLAGLWTFCTLKMWRYHCMLLLWSYVVVLTECTVWINYFCTWCARFAYA